MDVELVDLLEPPLNPTKAGIQTTVTSKKEFSDLFSEIDERPPSKRGDFYKHQKLTHRYLRVANDYMIISQTGTGKSLEILGFTEMVRLEKNKSNPDEQLAHFKKVVIISGKKQGSEIRNQLVCKASDGYYERRLSPETMTEKEQKAAIKRYLKEEGYVFTTYTTFSNDIRRDYYDQNGDFEEDKLEDLKTQFADTIFWIDEAHNLIIDDKDKAKREKERTYETISLIFHVAPRCKHVLSTATPMINSVNDIGSLMNLLLPYDLPFDYDFKNASQHEINVMFPNLTNLNPKTATYDEMAPYFQGPFPINYDFESATLQDLEPRFRGRIGFVRSGDNGATQKEMGVAQKNYKMNGQFYNSYLIVYPSIMSEFQTRSYFDAKHDGKADVFAKVRQASNFVFPDGFWGSGGKEEELELRKDIRRAKTLIREVEGKEAELYDEDGNLIDESQTLFDEKTEPRAFRRYVENLGQGDYVAKNEFKRELRDFENIRKMSCKYASIIELSMNESGNVFVYSEYVETGIIVLALCLEAQGCERFRETSSIFLGAYANSVKPFCSGAKATSKNRRVRADIKSRKQGAPIKYCVLGKDTTESEFAVMMETMNSYENRHGDYIKIFISSRVGRDGINIHNVLQIHLLGPEWNQSAMYQALSRGIRANSHEDLLNEKKQELIEINEDPNNAKVEVKIYKHAAVPGFLDFNDSEDSGIDIRMYRVSETKDFSIRRILRIMKQVSVTCQIHYRRNVRSEDVDYSAACEYDICKYECFDPPPQFEDYSSYDVVYANDTIQLIVHDLKRVLKETNSIRISDLSNNYLKFYRPKMIIFALELVVSGKLPILDRYGLTSYLREINGTLYLDKNYPNDAPNSFTLSYYTERLIVMKRENLNVISSLIEAQDDDSIFSEIMKLDPNTPNFSETIESLSIDGQVSLLENAVLSSVAGQNNPQIKAIMDKFANWLFYIPEPITELNKLQADMQNDPRKRRAKNKYATYLYKRNKKYYDNYYNNRPLHKDEGGDMVYVHILYTKEKARTGYNATTAYVKAEGRIRLYNPSTSSTWRDVNKDAEYQVYNRYIKEEIAERNKYLDRSDIYGTVLSDGKFRIRDKQSENEDESDDKRKIKRGKVCTTWNRQDLVDIMYRVGLPEPQIKYTEIFNNRQQMIDLLISGKINKAIEEISAWPIERLIYYTKWFMIPDLKRNVICDNIREQLRENGLLQVL